MNKKRIMALALAAVLASGTTVFAAGSFTDFKDYNKDLGYGKLNGHWAQSNIKTLYEKGGISGYPEGDFRANKTISGAELIALILNASDNGENMVGDSWSDKIMNRAYELGMVTPSDISKADANKPISREKMALILVNSADKILNENTTGIKLVDTAVIKDLNSASASYRDEIRTAYSMGLLAGTGNGQYQPKSSTTRAEATAIVNRLFGYMDRVNVKYEAEVVPPVVTPTGTVKPITQQYPALPDGSNVVNGVNYPAEGMTYNGVKITRDDETGVLGYGDGQQGGIYLGVGKNNRYIKEGAVIGTGYDHMMGAYKEIGGAVFWEEEWGLIEQKVGPELDANKLNEPVGTVADLYGNIIPGGKMADGKVNVDNAAFVRGVYGWHLITN